jgi:hypothetical protein
MYNSIGMIGTHKIELWYWWESYVLGSLVEVVNVHSDGGKFLSCVVCGALSMYL